MAIKVLIVDDEKLERILIRKSFPWESHGFEVIGEAENGEQALEVIEAFHPQLILTDINMPKMDGLLMTEALVKMDYFCKVIIITGYRDFEYARQGIRLGVNDFILKPVQVKEMGETLLKVKEDLEKDESTVRLAKELTTQKNENHQILLESFLQRLVENRVEEPEVSEKMRLFGITAINDQCVCCNILLHFNTGEQKSYEKNQKTAALVKEILGTDDPVVFVHYQGMVVLLVPQLEKDQLAGIKNKINEILGISVVLAYSRPETGAGCIRRAFLEAKDALNLSVVKGHDVIISYDEYESIKNSGQKEVTIDWNDFTFSLEQGFVNKVMDSIDQYTGLMAVNERLDRDYLRLMAMNLISKASVTLLKRGKDVAALLGENFVYDHVSQISNISEMNQVLKEITGKILNYHMNSYTKRENKTIKVILEYMEEHMYEKELSLKTVAKVHFINDSYLSRIFKQEVGESMMEYIMKKRIQESVRMLNTTDLKAYEIAEQIGFGDPHYFSICFKKCMGVTVNEYKKTK